MCEKESVKGKLEKLVSLAESAEEGFNWRIACEYYYEAAELSESNGYYYHKIGLLEQECGNYEKAYKAFLKSIELSPNENATNYLYIAQYCQGKDSENAYLKAIDILENELKKISKNDDNSKMACASNGSNGSNGSKSELDDDDIKMSNDKNEDSSENNENNENSISKYKYSISNIYVSIGELYTTDLCDIENAEMIAQSYFEESIKWCANNPESHCAFGEFRLLQCKKEEAKKEFELCVKYLINDNSGNNGNTNGNTNENELNNELKSELNEKNEYNISKNESITIDSLIKMIKLGIECESYGRTLILCDYILKIDENNGQAWGLGSLCFYNLNDKHECAIWLNNAKIILSELEDEFDKESLINVLNVVESNIDMNGLPDIDNDDNDDEYESEDKFDDNANSKRINYIVDEINEKLGRTYIAKRKEPDTGDTGDSGDMNEVESFLNDDDNDDDDDDNDDNDDHDDNDDGNQNNEKNENDQMLDID